MADTLEERYVLILRNNSTKKCVSVTRLVSPWILPGLFRCGLHWSCAKRHHYFWVESCDFCFSRLKKSQPQLPVSWLSVLLWASLSFFDWRALCSGIGGNQNQ